MKNYNAVIPVAGLGTRLLPATKSQPKEMLTVGRKPIVQYIVEELMHSGINRLLFVTGRGKNSIEDHFDENHELIQNLRESGKEDLLAELEFERNDVAFFYTRQKKQLGLGDAVLCAKDFTGSDPFLVALGDSIIGNNQNSLISKRLIQVFEEEKAEAIIAVQEVPKDELHHYGVVSPKKVTGDILELDGVIEKPKDGQAPSNYAIAARYVFSPRIFKHLEEIKKKREEKEVQLTTAIQMLIKEGCKVLALPLKKEEKRYDIGNFKSYYETFFEFALNDPEYGEALKERFGIKG